MNFPDLFRLGGIILLVVATATVMRFYTTRPKMPVGALVAVLAATVSMAATVIFKVAQSPDTGFRWWVTPPVYVYSVAVIVGLWPYMRVRR